MSNTAQRLEVSAALADKVEELSRRLDRSSRSIVEEALTAWIDDEEEHRRMTHEGLDDVDAGRHVDHATALAFVSGLKADRPASR